MRDGDGEEETDVLLLKFGDELAKRGEERRLLLEFMEGGILGKLTKVEEGEAEEMDIVSVTRKKPLSFLEGGRGGEKPHTQAAAQFDWFTILDASATPIQERVCLTS